MHFSGWSFFVVFQSLKLAFTFENKGVEKSEMIVNSFLNILMETYVHEAKRS
jgi:hypothetical protein